ncbi:hypothetical protein ABCS02_17630 [Microbacterium sp. X-17]|uniref:hypothetical protein n=1 Tax=Microbacterium sp. X-17 TaxID=3144404 RepID=UPI0031F54B3C
MTEYYNPYAGFGGDDRRWLKSQFHMHNLRGDPARGSFTYSMEGMDDFFWDYKAAGFDVVAHAMHNDMLDTSHLDELVGIRSFNGEEYVDYDGILLVGIKRGHRGEPQDVIDETNAEGGFAIICHPNQNPALSELPGIPVLLTKEMSRTLTGVVGVEIYTGCLSRREMAGVPFGLSLATDYWDEALSSGRLLWGFATDDSHNGWEMNVGWTDVLSATDDFPAFKSAVVAGAVVASRGMRLYGWSFDGEVLQVEADLPYQRAGEAEYRFISDGGVVRATERGRTGSYRLQGDETYLRVEALNGDGSILWTQPLLARDRFEVPTV